MVLKYSSKIPQKPSIRAIRFWQGYWNLNDNRIASRSDIMKVLVDVDAIYIRLVDIDRLELYIYLPVLTF